MASSKLYTKKLAKRKRTYFFDLKQSGENDFYLIITENRKTSNGLEHHRILVDREDLEDFADSFRQCLNSCRKLERELAENGKRDRFIRTGKAPAKPGAAWSADEDNLLEFLYCEGKKLKEMAVRLEREKEAIESRINELGLKDKYE